MAKKSHKVGDWQPPTAERSAVGGDGGLWRRLSCRRVLATFQSPVPACGKSSGKSAGTGTRDWQNYSVVLDVAPNATGIGMGILLSGAGEVWISGMKFETVGLSVPVTVEKTAAKATPDAPVNLSFEK